MLELAAAAADAGGRAVFDAEELGLEQRFDQRRAIDRDERAMAPASEVVNLTGDELFANAALALEQHGEIGAGHPLDGCPQRVHHARRSDQRRGAVPPRARSARRGGTIELRARS